MSLNKYCMEIVKAAAIVVIFMKCSVYAVSNIDSITVIDSKSVAADELMNILKSAKGVSRLVKITNQIKVNTLLVPAEISVEIDPGGEIANSSDVYFNGPFTAGNYQVFKGGGNVYFRSDTVVLPSWFGAITDNVKENARVVQKAINSLSKHGGVVRIPRGCVYSPKDISFIKNVTIYDDSDGQISKTILNGANKSGAVNEFIVESGFHPGIILNVLTDKTLDTLKSPQIYSHRESIVYRVDGNGKWQIANDINATNNDILTVYSLSKGRQLATYFPNGKTVIGQLSKQDFTEPDYSNTLRGNTCVENESNSSANIILRAKDNSRRKIVSLDINDNYTISNTKNTENILILSNSGHLATKRGVSGGAFTSDDRRGIKGVSELFIGLMIYDVTLGKPLWLHSVNPLIWHDANGNAVY